MEVYSPMGSRRRDEPEFTLKEWNLRGRLTRENNTISRRFSGSYIRSFREESNRSFRSNITISSTASSPGYHLKDEIDPSTYSFTTALKGGLHEIKTALQARSGYVWECLSPDGFALNSKWHEAERYICNPQSGQFPMECLSTKSVSGRSFHSVIASKITMSAPLVYSSRRFNNCPKPPTAGDDEKDQNTKTKNQEFKTEDGYKTRDMGTQSTLPDQSQCSISYCSSPPPPNKAEWSNSCDEKLPSSKLISMEEEVEAMKATKEEEEDEDEEDTKRNTVQEQLNKKQNSVEKLCRCYWQSGCLLSWRCLWMRKRHRDKHKITH